MSRGLSRDGGNSLVGGKAVHLDEQLVEGLLALRGWATVRRLLPTASKLSMP
jgi:hypothetical protein